MKKITGKALLKLGFTKEYDVDTEALPSENKYHYYTYEIGKNCLLISCSNDEKKDGGYYVEFYEIMNLKIRDLRQLKKLIKILKKAEN